MEILQLLAAAASLPWHRRYSTVSRPPSVSLIAEKCGQAMPVDSVGSNYCKYQYNDTKSH